MTNKKAPTTLTPWLLSHARVDAIHGQSVKIDLEWWNLKLEAHGHWLVGLRDGSVTSDGRAFISRAHLFDMASDAQDSDPVRFLWHVIAWGSGGRNRNNIARIKAVYEEPRQTERILRSAFQAASRSPHEAFMSMRGPGNSNAIKFLGPAFFTKVLYFAGAGKPEHPSLIVDNRVLATLHATTDEKGYNRRFGYPVSTYQAAVELMQKWALQESEKLNQKITADEIERWAFHANGNLTEPETTPPALANVA